MSIENLPANKTDRIIGCKYLYNDEIRIWTGKILHCEHNKRLNRCRLCGGSEFCEHDKIKYKCIQCKGASICEHNILKNICTNCMGSGVCEHKKRKSQCVKCKGSYICIHNIVKNQCVKCHGKGICEHNKRKTQCKKCKGISICEHNKQITQCLECKGISICVHSKIKSRCIDCFSHPQNFCQLCTFIYVKNSSYYPYCFKCYCYLHPDENIPRRFRIKENYINDFLKNYYPDIVNNKTIASSCSSGKRPDWYIELLTHTIIIECDEDQHNNYSCENKRMMQLFTDLGDRPIVFIRFNPDKYNEKNISSSSGEFNTIIHSDCFYYNDKNKLQVNETEWRERSKILLQTIKDNEKIPDKEVTIIKLFFTEKE